MKTIAALLLLLLAYFFALLALGNLIGFPLVWLASIGIARQNEAQMVSPFIMIAAWIIGTLFWLALAKLCAYFFEVLNQ